MSTRVVTAIASGTAAQAATTLAEDLRRGLGDAPPALIAVFASTKQPLAEVQSAVAAAFPGVALIGTSTAGELTERGSQKGSVAALALAGAYRVFAGMSTGLRADPEKAVAQALDGLPTEVAGYPHRTAILLLDPLAGNGEEVTLIAASMLGESVPLAGGAAGDDLAMLSPLVGIGDKAAPDAVVVAIVFSKVPLGVGVCHAHAPMSGPLRVTRSEGATVFEVDGRRAWDVWRDVTRTHAASRGIHVDQLAPSEEGPFLLLYEAGLAAGGEHKIRAPLSRTSEGAIQFACGLPEGTVFRITESRASQQIESAKTAAARARQAVGGRTAGAIVFDCICRSLILGDAFGEAVRAISAELGDAPIAGFETYGEIALDVGDLSGFHNTTSVVLAFPEA